MELAGDRQTTGGNENELTIAADQLHAGKSALNLFGLMRGNEVEGVSLEFPSAARAAVSGSP